MKKFLYLILGLMFLFPASNVLAQAGIGDTKGVAPKTGCKTIDFHCLCQNPARDFWVRDRKLGANPTEKSGQCSLRKEIDEYAKRNPITVCLKHGNIKDPREETSQCRVEWKCKESCVIKTGTAY